MELLDVGRRVVVPLDAPAIEPLLMEELGEVLSSLVVVYTTYGPVGTDADAFATEERLAVTPLIEGSVPYTRFEAKDVVDDGAAGDEAVAETVVCAKACAISRLLVRIEYSMARVTPRRLEAETTKISQPLLTTYF